MSNDIRGRIEYPIAFYCKLNVSVYLIVARVDY